MTPSTQIAPSSGDELLFLLLPLIPKLSTREWSLLLALAVLPYGPVAKAHGDPLSCLDMKALQYGRYTATECLEDLHTLKRLGWVEIQDGTGSWDALSDTPYHCPVLGCSRVYIDWRRLRECAQ
jgi:hypothetical protein